MGRLFENLFSRRSGATSTEFGTPLLRLDERSDGGAPHRLLGASSSREAVERSMVYGLQNAPCEGEIDFDRSARRLHPTSSARHRDSPRNGLLSTESTRPPRSIRRLTGWVTLLRSRRGRDKAAWEAFPVPDRSACHAPINPGDRADGHLVPCASFLSEDPSSRKPSDRTTVSDLTAVTVSHHPSRRTLTPIPTVDRDLIFEDAGPDSTRSDDPPVTTAPVVQANPGFLYADVPFDFFPEPVERDVDEITLPACHCGSSSTESSGLPRSVSKESRWSGGLDRQAAAIAFNELAGKFQFVPLPVPPDGEDAELDRTDETVPRRRDRVLVRIRSMRSSLSLGSPVSPPRTLRRRRTVVGVRSPASAMTSLCGKPLEDLARLGGHSFLFLPPEFAPAPLRLPVCFVATAKYLRRFGPHVHDLFWKKGDPKTATRVYEYFARQVRSAEREQDRIQETTRRSQMPVELEEVLRPDGSSDHASQVQGVAWAFKTLVAGLPGGLLGSSRLYEALVDLSHHRHHSGVERSSARVQGIGLAIVALTSPLQRNLLCGVIGLCTSLVAGDGETEGAIRHRLDGLIQAWEPVLRGQTGRTADAFSAVEREIEGQRVAGMLIDNWRRINRQLVQSKSGG